MRGTIGLLGLLGLLLAGCGGGGEVPAEATPAEPATPDPAIEDAHSDALSAKIKEGKEGLYTCGSAEKTGGDPVYGKLSVTFEIRPDGTIGKLVIEENATGNEVVAACVLEAIVGWSFPAHPYGESIEYTYPFEVGF
jgi:hypothetical protein